MTTTHSSAGWSPHVQATFCATLVDEWARCGLTDAVICPGSRSTPLATALAGDDRIRVHVHHDERSGSFHALGLAHATGRPAVVVTTSGTAGVELHAAAVEADLAGVPIILCTADRPPELRDVAAPQAVDQERLFGRSTRWYVDAGVPDGAAAHTWRSLAARAWIAATGSWPGPVQVNLPFREPLVGRSGGLPPARAEGPWHVRVTGTAAGVVLDPSLTAQRGIVVAGRGTTDPEGVTRLSEQLGWPLLADPLSGCRGPSSILAFDALLRTGLAERVRPDVVVRSGGLPASKVLGQWLEASAATEVVIVPETWWPDPAHSTAAFLDAVPRVDPSHEPIGEWREAWRVADELAQQTIDEVLAEFPLSEPAVARQLTAATPDGGALVVSSSMPVRDVEWYGVGRSGLRVIGNRGANGIDGVVSTAVGVASAGLPTTLLIGDIAFLHDSNGLLGISGRGVDLTIVVLDNDGGGIFSFLPQRSQLEHERFEQLFGTPHGLDVVALARGYGLDAEEVSDGADLVWRPGTRVLVVRTDRDENVAVHDRIHEAVRAAVEA